MHVRTKIVQLVRALSVWGVSTTSLMAQGLRTEIPVDPPSLCFEGCTERMSQVAQGYTNLGQLAPLRPSFYSGECAHLHTGLDPEVVHHAMVLIDRRPDGSPYFATTFSYFAGEDEAKAWTLREARANMSRDWLNYGPIKVSERSSHLVIWQDRAAGEVAWVYWWRRNPVTGELYYITYWGASGGQSYCQLQLRDEEL